MINTREGDWFPSGLGQSYFKGLYGYKVFIAIALVLGDGLYNFVKILFVSAKVIHKQYKSQQLPTREEGEEVVNLSLGEKKRRDVFLMEGIPNWVAVAGYVTLAAMSITLIPKVFTAMKWYFVFLCYL